MRRHLLVPAFAGIVLSLSACDVEKTDEGEMPEVDVKGGDLPNYDVDAADVDVGTEKKTVEVPTIGVDEPDARAEKTEAPAKRY
jgi:hypothetical protein